MGGQLRHSYVCCCLRYQQRRRIDLQSLWCITCTRLEEALAACMQPLAVADPYQAIRITARLGFNARGQPLGSPQFTYVTPNVTDQIKSEYKRAVSDSLTRCTPLPFSPELGATIAGVPLILLFDERGLMRVRAGRVIGLCCPSAATLIPNSFSTDQSRRCCSRQRARSHQSGCPVLLVPFQACRTGQRPHRTAVPVACSSPDYMACHSQTFRQYMGFCSQ